MTIDASSLYELHDLVTAALLKEAQGIPQGIDPRMLEAARKFLSQNGIKINQSGQTLATLANTNASTSEATSETTVIRSEAKVWTKEVQQHPFSFD